MEKAKKKLKKLKKKHKRLLASIYTYLTLINDRVDIESPLFAAMKLIQDEAFDGRCDKFLFKKNLDADTKCLICKRKYSEHA